MAYQIKILMLAFAIAFVISLIVIPILRRRKIGQQERDDGPKSHNTTNISNSWVWIGRLCRRF